MKKRPNRRIEYKYIDACPPEIDRVKKSSPEGWRIFWPTSFVNGFTQADWDRQEAANTSEPRWIMKDGKAVL